MPSVKLKDWQVFSGCGAMFLSQIILFVLLVHWGNMIATDQGRIAPRHIALLIGALSLQCVAGYLLRSKTLWWQTILWASAMASCVVSVIVFFAAFPFSWHLLVPAAASFVIFVGCATALAYLQEKFVK